MSKQIADNTKDMIAKLTGDPNIDPSTLTEDQLRDMGLDPSTIDEIMKLKDIHDKVKDGQPVDAADIAKDLEDVKKLLEKDIKDKEDDKENLANPDTNDHLLHDANKLEKSMRALPITGVTDPKDDYQVKNAVTDVMRDLAGDQN